MSTIITPSEFGYKARWFTLCDDGSRVCWGCLSQAERDMRQDDVKKVGRCYHCGLEVA